MNTLPVRTVRVGSRNGLHARPAALVVEAAAAQPVHVRIRRDNGPAVDARSVLSLLALGAGHGEAVTLEADGDRAGEALDALAAVLAYDHDDGDGACEQPNEDDGANGGEDMVDRGALWPPVPDALVGLSASPGLAAGPALVMQPRPRLPGPVPVDDVGLEVAAAIRALDVVAADLRTCAERTGAASARAILAGQAMMIADPALRDAVIASVQAGTDAPHAIDAAIAWQRCQLEAVGGYFAGRVGDLDDIRDRAVAAALGLPTPGVPTPGYPYILVADDISPADAATLDTNTVLALVTERGAPTSHTAILARAVGLPAVVACSGAMRVKPGTPIWVDSAVGKVHLGVPAPVVDEVRRRASRHASRLTGQLDPGSTADGHPVELLLNIRSADDLRNRVALHAEGVGLVRTEFLFLNRRDAPTRDEQRSAYEAVFRAAGTRKVVIRTFDTGADKPLPFVQVPTEPNPALGMRGLRTARYRPEVLDTQLDAIAKAAAKTRAQVWITAPMVATYHEAATFAAAARSHGLDTVGIMVEIPAAALHAQQMLETLDFLSIGTNDLSQYTLAADRQSGDLADLLNPWQPALLRLIAHCAGAGLAAHKPVTVCGEAAADPLLALVLVGLGVTSLSMSAHGIRPVQRSLAAHSLDECRNLATRALEAKDADQALALVEKSSMRRDG